jgi:hypothetical protein
VWGVGCRLHVKTPILLIGMAFFLQLLSFIQSSAILEIRCYRMKANHDGIFTHYSAPIMGEMSRYFLSPIQTPLFVEVVGVSGIGKALLSVPMRISFRCHKTL